LRLTVTLDALLLVFLELHWAYSALNSIEDAKDFSLKPLKYLIFQTSLFSTTFLCLDSLLKNDSISDTFQWSIILLFKQVLLLFDILKELKYGTVAFSQGCRFIKEVGHILLQTKVIILHLVHRMGLIL
jgi:hypothetical protein